MLYGMNTDSQRDVFYWEFVLTCALYRNAFLQLEIKTTINSTTNKEKIKPSACVKVLCIIMLCTLPDIVIGFYWTVSEESECWEGVSVLLVCLEGQIHGFPSKFWASQVIKKGGSCEFCAWSRLKLELCEQDLEHLGATHCFSPAFQATIPRLKYFLLCKNLYFLSWESLRCLEKVICSEVFMSQPMDVLNTVRSPLNCEQRESRDGCSHLPGWLSASEMNWRATFEWSN